MPGPTTEVLNDDLKTLKDDVHRLDVGLAEIRAELKVLIGVATWGVRLATGAFVLVVTTLISGAFGAAWWASGISSELRNLTNQVVDIRKDFDSRQPRPAPVRTNVPPAGIEETRIPTPGARP